MNIEKLKEGMFDGIEKITTQRHINAIKNGMVSYVPFTIIAAIALLIANFPSESYINFVTNLLGVSDASVWQNQVTFFMDGTMNLAAIICLLFISYNLSLEYKGIIDPIYSIVMSLCVYFLLTPLVNVNDTVMLEFAKLGATSLIVAIVIALVIPELYRLLMSRKLQIKLPSSVPPAVAGSFANLIPMAIIFIGAWVLKIALLHTSFGNIHVIINDIIGKPLTGMGGNIYGYAFAIFITFLLWVFGIHGSSIVMFGVLAPVLMMMSDANRQAALNGQPLPNILTYEYFSFIGGVGLYICIACLIVGKSKQIREIAKIGLLPAIFGIHEPLIFGLPIIFNPFLGTAYILEHVVGAVLTYFVTAAGLISRLTGIGVTWTTPPGIYGFLATGGHISGFVWQIILGVLYVLLAIPFVKMYDRQKLKEESMEGEAV